MFRDFLVQFIVSNSGVVGACLKKFFTFLRFFVYENEKLYVAIKEMLSVVQKRYEM